MAAGVPAASSETSALLRCSMGGVGIIAALETMGAKPRARRQTGVTVGHALSVRAFFCQKGGLRAAKPCVRTWFGESY